MPITPETIESIKEFENPRMRQVYSYLWRHPQIKEVFFAVETSDKMFEIASKYNFPPARQRTLAATVGQVLLGEIPVANLTQKIQQNCGLQDTGMAEQIKNEVYNKVIKDVESYIEPASPVIASELQQEKQSPAVSQKIASPSAAPPGDKPDQQEIEGYLSQHGIKIEEE